MTTETESALRAENRALRDRLDQAPHGPTCKGGFLRGTGYQPPCTCWKADTGTAALDRAIREAKADALEEAANAAYAEKKSNWGGLMRVSVMNWLRNRAAEYRAKGATT